jgi:hypothetical protein
MKHKPTVKELLNRLDNGEDLRLSREALNIVTQVDEIVRTHENGEALTEDDCDLLISFVLESSLPAGTNLGKRPAYKDPEKRKISAREEAATARVREHRMRLRRDNETLEQVDRHTVQFAQREFPDVFGNWSKATIIDRVRRKSR